MKSALRIFVVLITSLYSLATRIDAAEPTPTPAAKTPPAGTKLMPSSEDIANDVVKEKTEEDQRNERAIASSLREGETVMIDGKRYLAFRSSHGTLLVPAAAGDIKREDLDSALCSPTPKVGDDQMVLGVEHPLSEKYTLYAGLMAKVIRDKCGAVQRVNPVPPKIQPEAGAKWKNGSKTGGEDRIFVNPRGIGAGSSF